jgi:UPF0271 protein
MRAPEAAVDLSADAGEGAGSDGPLLELVTTVHVACGAHAGDARTMRATCALAARHGVAVGAHPGYPDREGFGRRELGWDPARIAAAVAQQLDALEQAAGAAVAFVKPHGALYHRVLADADAAAAVREACAGRAIVGLDVAEGFCDRGLGPDGRLLDRGAPGALLDPPAAAAQAVALARAGRVATLCVHGDGPDPVTTARAVRAALAAAGIEVRAFAP